MVFNKLYDVLKKRFDDGNVNSPVDFKYMFQLQFLLSTVGAWPYKKFGRHQLGAILSVFNLFLIASAVTMCTLDMVYIIINTLPLLFLGHLILCWILAFMYLTRLVIFRTNKYQETIKEYLLEFHLFYFKGRSLYAAEVHTQTHTLSGMFTIYVISIMVVGIILFNFMPWYQNYSKGMFSTDRPENITFEHSVYFYMPDAGYTTIKGYWIVFVLNIYTSYVTAVGVFAFDLLLVLIVFQIWGHLRILKHSLLNMPLPANSVSGMYSVEENYQIRKLLKENILHHNFITKFVDQCSDAFSEYLFLFYLLMQFITCILLLEVTTFTADSVAKYGPLTVSMHQQLIQVSILFEMIHTKSEQLIDAVYATPWESMDNRNRRTVMFFLQRVQTPVSLKAAKVIPVGVNTMSAVLKTTFSYYMMLKTFAGE